MPGAWAPYGQNKVTNKKQLEDWSDTLNAFKKGNLAWPTKLMSFEVWCHVTMYDPRAADGGALFQQLMNFLLSHKTSQSMVTHDYSSSYFVKHTYSKPYQEPDPKKPKKQHTVQWSLDDDRYNGMKHGDLRIKAGDPDEVKYFYSPASQAVFTKPGGDNGHWGSTYDARGKGYIFEDPKMWLALLYSTPAAPSGRRNWWQSTGLTNVADDASVNQGTAITFASDGTPASGKCVESSGCPAFANICAMVIGLYYYTNCEDSANNWIVEQEIDGVTYQCRMRMYNPNLTGTGDQLAYRQEALNPKNKFYKQRKIIGSHNMRNAFPFPLIQSMPVTDVDSMDTQGNFATIGSYPFEPMQLLAGNPISHLAGSAPKQGAKSKKKQAGTYELKAAAPLAISPCLGEHDARQANGDYSNIRAQNKSIKESVRLLASKWPKRVNYTGDTYFGFEVPAALWLYPHYSLPGDSKPRIKQLKKGGKHVSKEPHWQPWPTLKENWKEIMNKYCKDKGNYEAFHELFKEGSYNFMTAAERRARALGHAMPAGPSGTVPKPVDAQQVDVSTPDEPDDAATETLHDGNGLYTGVYVDGAPTARQPAVTVAEPQEGEGDTVEFNTDQALDVAPVTDESIALMTQADLVELDGGEVKDRNNMEARELQQAVGAGRVLQELDHGAERRAADCNKHFKSAQHHPWPHKHLYEESSMEVVGEEMNEEALKSYRQAYGSTHNLFLRGEATPKAIKEVKVHYGKAKDKILGSYLTEWGASEHHRAHWCRILAIYFDETSLGSSRLSITAEQKRAGMTGGVWIKKHASHHQTIAGVMHYGKQRNTKEYERVWPPVFKGKPPSDSLKSKFNLDLMLGADATLSKCLVEDKIAAMDQMESEMTVLQWVTSPWHYAYLPYQPQTSLFVDGETYSEGCKRCSRPFYEYKQMYATYNRAVEKTAHYPMLYWHREKDAGTYAPNPIHEPSHWKDEEGKIEQVVPHDKSGTELPRPAGAEGWHNWQTFEFKLYKLTVAKSLMKISEKPEDVQRAITNHTMFPLTYRCFENHAWVQSRVGAQQRTFGQGKLTNGKVKFGMLDYKLSRVSKYCNLCKDCAAVLELAPGLFHRNHRTVYDPRLVVGNAEKVRHTPKTGASWWLGVVARKALSGATVNLDALFTKKPQVLSRYDDKGKERYLKAFEETMEVYTSYLQDKQHNMTVLEGRTKMRQPPDIHVQTVIPSWMGGKKGEGHEQDWQKIHRAVRDLKLMITDPKHAVDMENPALKDMIFALERKYVHLEKFKPDSNAKIFDPDMMRVEERNVQLTMTGPARKGESNVFENCLRIRTYQPRGAATGAKTKRVKGKDSAGNEVEQVQFVMPPAEDYVEKVYFATRRGGTGQATCSQGMPTMWCGDGYVTAWDDTKKKWVDATHLQDRNNPSTQVRTMRQSRLFITYSLHRPITSEVEGRLILERMADASYELFGNDVNLSELLIFGMKLDSSAHAPDTISRAKFVPITETNKDAAMPNFYANIKGSSYIYDTYETHVESVEVDGGMEIGPQRHHPHFHILLTINHWSYVQIDYYKMSSYLELMFKGLDPLKRGWKDRFKLIDASGRLFYTDNENPYVHIKLYPQDNWADVISAYVRKNTTPGVMEALSARTGRAVGLPTDYS